MSTKDTVTTKSTVELTERFQFDPTSTPFSLQQDDTISITSSNFTEGVDVIFGKKSKESSDSSSKNARNDFFQWLKMHSGRVILNHTFNRCVSGMILIFSALMGLSTLDWTVRSERRRGVFELLLFIFQVIFTVEWVLRVLHYQKNIPRKGWMLLDTLLLIVSWATLSPTILVFRTFRLIRALRKASGIAGLAIVTKALLRVIPFVGVILLLLAGLFYVFAVLLVRSFLDVPDTSAYFGDLGKALFTLLRLLTHDNWIEITREVLAYHPWVLVYIGSFLIVGSVLTIGMVVAACVETFRVVQEERLRVDATATSKRWKDSTTGTKELIIPNDDDQQQQLDLTVRQLADSVDQILRLQMSLQQSIGRLEEESRETKSQKSSIPAVPTNTTRSLT